MLTLLEPPGAKRSQPSGNYGNRSAQHLLNLAMEDDDIYDLYDGATETNNYKNEDSQPSKIKKYLNRHLVGKSSSGDYNEKWKKEFRVRPSWCDADLCLQQIQNGKATGNQWALYSRSFLQKMLFSLGNAVHKNAWTVIITISLLFAMCCYGLQYVHIETDIVKLWVAQGGRLDEELNFLSTIKANSLNNNTHEGGDIPRENGLGGGYQVLIQTPEFEGQNALGKEPLLKHVDIMNDIASFKVDVHGESWSLTDICFKPAPPTIANDSIAVDMVDMIERIVPCIWITPIDCFWEGSKPLGPHPYLNKTSLSAFASLISSLPDGPEIKWYDFDPWAVISEIHGVFNLGSHFTFFERAGVAHGYMDRPCIDPMDPDCPKMAPNHFDVCPHVRTIMKLAKEQGKELEKEVIEEKSIFESIFGFGRKKRDAADPTEVTEATPVVETTESEADRQAKEAEEKAREEARVMKQECKDYHRSAKKWLAANRDKWDQVLTPEQHPKPVDYGSIMSGGCHGFASNVLNWPEDMILGGAKREKKRGPLTSAAALQSVFLVASPQDIYLRFKQKPGRSSQKSNLDQSLWDEKMAEEVLQAWQRNFTRRIYNHPSNTDEAGNERRTLHPLASTSIADMLEEFCQFNYTIIAVGYLLMLVYAIITQARTNGLLPATESFIGLAFFGVIVVTFASVAGLGLATWFGIEFNAATTQIVPFLSLGIGVDNMFMMLHNYRDLMKISGGRNEMGILMRETGMSIMCTSINNILSFLTGTLLPIPALRSFCAQSSILLTFNFIAILTVYPAIISLDLRRRKMGRRDIFCWMYGDTREESYSMISKPQMPTKRIIGASETSMIEQYDTSAIRQDTTTSEHPSKYSLHSFIRYYYIPFISIPVVKVGVIIMCSTMLGLSIMGIQKSTLGLELSDILPAHTAPAQFLQARDKYFSFYPMFAVLKGPNIDYAMQQRQIENYRSAIGTSKYVIKNKIDEPSEKHWLGLMRDWLRALQKGFDEEMKKGSFDIEEGTIINGNVSEDARLAYSLMCSVGDDWQCKGRVGKIRLVDNSGIIDVDGFYNYLTAWFNVDHMMYYVSQASFYPTPPKWELKKNSVNFVPPAEKLAYSQIPFYLTGLTDTPVIVHMIEDIRGVCNRFTEQGLSNFPQGIAFTFWEQYLYLSQNLMQAIGIIALAVLVVISVLLFNPWAAAMVLFIVTLMTVELAGFMGWMGIKLNPVSAVTLITAVGIGVEFTVHVVVSFLTSLGTRTQRTSAAVDRVFVPVIHGSLSTLLGILMLGFSEFEFVVKYFFIVMSALIASGVINGLVLLPVLLSWFGPPREITPTDGRTRLQLPRPLERGNRISTRGTIARLEDSDDEEDPSGLVMFSRRTNSSTPRRPVIPMESVRNAV